MLKPITTDNFYLRYELVLWNNRIKLNDNMLIFQEKAIQIISLSHNLDLGKPIFIYNLIIQTSVNLLDIVRYIFFKSNSSITH